MLLMTSCKRYDQIRVLSLRDLGLTSVFKHIWKRCENLQLLFLGGNNITNRDINDNLHKMPQLLKLDMSSNDLKYLPRDKNFFSKLKNLQVLILQDNLFESPAELVGLQGAQNLRHIILEDNPIVEAGAGFSKWDSKYRF